ncbi:hypothetical protein EV386_2311 [Xylanimonas ulmi]|uniref:Uncharacterized protein n=1 Tax=Xylanimonas ulmi TaxID=228973 RepID=A0A4Q7M3A0_9MICO|nr:hypothetical protein EV386_2311 [Xylanibacterium ulmi]
MAAGTAAALAVTSLAADTPATSARWRVAGGATSVALRTGAVQLSGLTPDFGAGPYELDGLYAKPPLCVLNCSFVPGALTLTATVTGSLKGAALDAGVLRVDHQWSTRSTPADQRSWDQVTSTTDVAGQRAYAVSGSTIGSLGRSTTEVLLVRAGAAVPPRERRPVVRVAADGAFSLPIAFTLTNAVMPAPPEVVGPRLTLADGTLTATVIQVLPDGGTCAWQDALTVALPHVRDDPSVAQRTPTTVNE